MTTVGGVPRSGEEIQAALTAFVARWKSYQGTERAEAQTYLNELFACYGTDRNAVGARLEDFTSSAGFMDLHWPQVCIIEMKRPSRAGSLSEAREQIMRYWRESADEVNDLPAAPYVVLCAFQSFEVWEPGRFPGAPRISFEIEELPDRYESLMFLAAPTLAPSFADHYRELTKEATASIALLYQSLKDRSAAPIDEIQRFTLQCVWSLFAEDLGMLDGYPLQNIVQTLRQDPTRSPAAEIGMLFRVLNQKGDHNRQGVLKGTRFVNGELFAQPAAVDLNQGELALVARAAEHDWRKVDPTIFGSLMEGVLGRARRWELGAHYTHEVDILKIVEPTIVRPWRQRIDACSSPTQARELLDELCSFRVLDPACGCGNFLYVAYRELRSLEHQLKARITTLAADQGLAKPIGPWPHYRLSNLQGIDIEGISVLIARVTLWMGHRQMIDRFGEAEPVLPLVDLSSIRVADALTTAWPETDVIVGNPPFLGASHVRGAFGDEYVDWLKAAFGVGVKDFCTYWFRKAHAHLKLGQRAGLVGTNSISQNLGRSASLDYIVANGGTITDAVSSQKWPGEAKVHVSLVNWAKHDYAGPFLLDGLAVVGITSSLTAGESDAWKPRAIAQNKDRCFEGPSPKAKGLLVTAEIAHSLLARSDADYAAVVRPYLTAGNITDDPSQGPSRWVIDFALRPLERAQKYPAALEIVRRLVKPERETNNRKSYREKWWIFAEPRTAMRAALSGLKRFPAMARHGKRLVLAFELPATLASDATDVFAFHDDFSMGVLQSRTHVAWAWAQASTLKGDLRYTPTSVFMTFPWAGAFADDLQREVVAEACRQLLARRAEICEAEQIGLTKLYNAMDEGAWADLKTLHQALDESVAACYGWPRSAAQDDAEIVRRLTALNKEITEGGRAYDPFAAVGDPT